MNLAILIGHFPPGVVGGAELQAEGWALRLAKRHRVTVITRRDPPGQPPHEQRDGFQVLRLPVARLPLWRTLHDLLGIEREVARLDPRPDALLCFQTFISGLAGVRIQKRLGIPAIVWVRGEDEVRSGTGDRSRWIAPRVWEDAAAVLVQSGRVREALLDGLRRAAPRRAESIAAKVVVVPNGLSLPAASGPLGQGILSVGRLIPDKGMDLAIEAAAIAGVPLTIAGDGPERGRLESLAAARGAAVRFVGAVARDRLDALYRDSACVVLAARRGEGLPNALLEAMGHGRAVVATPVMGVIDLVSPGENGLLVPPQAAALADALMRLAGDRALAARLGRAARITAEAFAWERVEPQLDAVLSAARAPAHA